MAEDVVVAKPEIEPRPGVTVVSGENFKEFVDGQLGVTPAEGAESAEVEQNTDPEAAAKAEHEAQEKAKAEAAAKAAEPKEGDIDGAKVYFKGKWVGKQDFNYRLHVQTEAKAKESAEAVAKAQAEVKEAREAAETAQKAADALKAKYEPPPPLEQGPEPQPGEYQNLSDYTKALKEWTADATRREDAAKQATAQREKDAAAAAKAWSARQAAYEAENAGYRERITNSAIKVSDELRDAIVGAENGPKILDHLAQHPDIAEEMGKMSVRNMLVAFGELKSALGTPAKVTTKPEIKAVPEISKAPAPISPLKGGNAISGLKVDENGEWIGTYEEFKAARAAGKIK